MEWNALSVQYNKNIKKGRARAVSIAAWPLRYVLFFFILTPIVIHLLHKCGSLDGDTDAFSKLVVKLNAILICGISSQVGFALQLYSAIDGDLTSRLAAVGRNKKGRKVEK